MNYKKIQTIDFKTITKGEKISARILDLDIKINTKVFVFSEENDVYSCLLPTKDSKTKLPELKGLKIRYEPFITAGTETKEYILIECSISVYLSYYIQILKEIIFEFDNSDIEMAKCVFKVISKWRHFLAEPSSRILSEEEIVGLIGELMFLYKISEKYNDKAVEYWQAERGEEDFINENQIIEVKSTLKETHEHIINGIDQLLVYPNRNKYILSLLFVKSPLENSFNLPTIIKNCENAFFHSPEIIDTFYKKLKARGYDLRDVSSYLEFNFALLTGGYFKIDEAFPKLTTFELNSPLSARISKVRYTIDMQGLNNLDFLTTPIDKIF